MVEEEDLPELTVDGALRLLGAIVEKAVDDATGRQGSRRDLRRWSPQDRRWLARYGPEMLIERLEVVMSTQSAAENALDWYYELEGQELAALGEWLEENPPPSGTSQIQHAWEHREEIEGVSS